MKHRSMTVLRAGMLLLSAALFGALVWLLWQTVPWAAVRWGILGLCAAIMAAGTVLCLAIPAQLMGLFTQNPESIRAGAEALRIISEYVETELSVPRDLPPDPARRKKERQHGGEVR